MPIKWDTGKNLEELMTPLNKCYLLWLSLSSISNIEINHSPADAAYSHCFCVNKSQACSLTK